MKRLLLHICCAPDATVGIERLKADFDVVGLFYNPNIHPRSEYDKRLAAMRTVSEIAGFPFIEGPYKTSSWFDEVKGLEGEPEKGLRCEACIRMRLRATARISLEEGFDAFAAVLTVSPRKDAAMINRYGEQAAEEFGVEYLPTDLKKKDGFKRSVELSRQYGLYRQDYCGCEFSKRKEKGESKKQKE
jgi:predicted adenine nucleotide alpha hydrolase (AANH) superfamily ATPase